MTFAPQAVRYLREHAEAQLRQAQAELARLQRVCPHENVEKGQIVDFDDAGVLTYYDTTYCLDCGLSTAEKSP